MSLNIKRFVVCFVGGLGCLILLYILYHKYRETHPSERDYPQIEQEGVLRIVTDYNPATYYVSDDTIAGFNNDLLQLLQQKIPFKIDIQLESSFDKEVKGLQNNDYDIITRNIPVTSEQKDKFKFTIPIIRNRQVLVQRNKKSNGGIAPIRSHLDMAKKTLYVPKGSPAILRIKNLAHEIGDTIYYIEDGVYESEQLIMRVAAKEIDFAVCDEKIARKMAESNPEIDYETSIGFTHLEAWAVRENSPILLDSLNKWIEQIQRTPEFEKIYRRYYK